VHRVNEAYVSVLTEPWDSTWAFGVEGGGSFGDETWQYGLAAGARLVTAEPGPFQLNELSGALRVSLTLQRVAGLRARLGLGPSVLLVTPSEGASAPSGTVLSTALLELAISRPFWLGRLGLEPALGARVFTAARSVTLDGQEAFELPLFVPQASLALVYRP
jgi:hypothetical protein